MNDINNIIVENFNENIEYIKTDHPKLFEKLSAFDTAVTNGHYQEKYDLVFENSNFDVFEHSSGNYLYDKQTDFHTQKSLASLDDSTQHNCFETFVRQSYSDDIIDTLKEEKKSAPLKNHLSYAAELIHFTNKRTNNVLQSFDKFIFFGSGLGLHITAMTEKIQSSIYLIVEDDLELFRLSLMCINYKKIAQKAKIFFSVFEDETEYAHTVEHFLKEQYYLNHYIKYFQLLSHSDDPINKFHVALSSQTELRFLFNDYLNNLTLPLNPISQGYNILSKGLNFTKGFFHNKPFMLIASGPSLQKNIEFLKENAKNFVIVAVSSSLSFLEQNNIQPQIVLHLDPFEPSIQSFKKLKSLSFLDNSLLFASMHTPIKILQMLKKENVFLFEAGSNYKEEALNISSACVGSLGYFLLVVLKASEIYLLGLDLAVDSTTGANHIETHQNMKTLKLENSLNDAKALSYKHDLFEIRGNLREEVFTSADFFTSVNLINNYFSQLVKPFQTIYNLSDGAWLQNTIALETKDIRQMIPLADSTFTKLQTHVQKNSLKGFNSHEFQSMQNKWQFAFNLKQELSQVDPLEFTPKEYAARIYELICGTDNLQKYEISRVLDSYLYYMLHFAYHFLNNQDTSLEEFKKLDQIFKDNIFDLINYYISSLENILQKDKTNG